MQFPESWLREFCNPPLTTQELAETLTMAGLEVEELAPVAPPFSKIVVGEIKELNLTESRRLQLTVEESKVTGLLHRVSPRLSNPIAAVCRWRISPLPGVEDQILPGIGFPRWQVQIEKVRNGEPGSWPLEFRDGTFELTSDSVSFHQYVSKVG